MESLKRPKAKARPVHVLTSSEVSKILTACKSPRDVAMIRLMLSSGLRRSEVTRLDIGDVDLKARTVQVRSSAKTGRPRMTVVDSDTCQALWRMLRDRDAEPSSPLFVSQTGGRLTPDGVNQAVIRISERSGVAVHPHQFRHLWTHLMLSSGVGERDVMTLAC